jgi:hypothetical protein
VDEHHQRGWRMVMSSRYKSVILIGICLLGGGLLLFVFQSHVKEIAPSDKILGMQSPQTFEDPQRSEENFITRERGASIANSRMKVDRSSPERALDAILQSLSSSKFDQFFESFSKTGKESLAGGAEINEQELLSMSQSLAAAGFENLQVVSAVFEHRGDFVDADVTVESQRRGRRVTEKLEVTFSGANGEWFVDSFEVVSVPK